MNAATSPAETVTSFLESVWGRGELARIPEFIAPGYRVEGAVVGPDWVRDNVTMNRDAFSDLKLTIERIVANDNQVAAMVRIEGRHTGPIKGFVAQNRQVSYREAGFWETDPETGLILTGDFVADTLLLRIQMGAASPALWHGPVPDPGITLPNRD